MGLTHCYKTTVFKHLFLLVPLTFIVLIDDLNTDCMIHKFVDDTTLSEFIDKGQASQMNVNVTQLLNCSSNNHINVNFKKTEKNDN